MRAAQFAQSHPATQERLHPNSAAQMLPSACCTQQPPPPAQHDPAGQLHTFRCVATADVRMKICKSDKHC